MQNIHFENNKATLLAASYDELNKLAGYLKRNPAFKIELAGYTDNAGDEKANTALSLARAKAVTDYLVSAGIAKDRISFRGLGSQSPIKPNDTEANRQLNRRVEFKIIK